MDALVAPGGLDPVLDGEGDDDPALLRSVTYLGDVSSAIVRAQAIHSRRVCPWPVSARSASVGPLPFPDRAIPATTTAAIPAATAPIR
ncbi:hypothetical protein SHKM778_75500 [Streptomyces sp. KM77-8]|uniref:Uncharacterized protein n=1 Tax=Streptomyces haneummycinicus TaxID=3074435 RepID=A0AAT9HUZ0_9ACTN